MAEYWKNGQKYIVSDITPEEMNDIKQREEHEYWTRISYDAAVEAEIAKRYTIGQELAIQRQKDEKPEEYAVYYAYCEECKAYVKAQFKKYNRQVGEILCLF